MPHSAELPFTGRPLMLPETQAERRFGGKRKCPTDLFNLGHDLKADFGARPRDARSGNRDHL